MKFCKSCGTALEDNARFCEGCGAQSPPLPAAVTGQPQQAQTPPPQYVPAAQPPQYAPPPQQQYAPPQYAPPPSYPPAQKPPRKKPKPWIIAVALVVVAAIVIVLINPFGGSMASHLKGEERTVGNQASGFLGALLNLNVNKMLRYVDPAYSDATALLDKKELTAMLQDELGEDMKNAKLIMIYDVYINSRGDSAQAYFILEVDGERFHEELPLSKVEDKWYVGANFLQWW